jgi:hypothetical protein
MTLPRTKLVGVICVAVGLTLYGTWLGWLSTRTERPVDPDYCSTRKNLQTQLAAHGFKLDPTHGGELPDALPADVIGLAFLDFDHKAIGLGRGSDQVRTLWELHPAIVNLAP